MSVSAVAPGRSVCAPLPVLGRDVTVPLVTGGEVTYAALDYAASAPALQRVWDDVAAYAPYYGSVHRGAGYLSQLSTELFESSRRTVAEFLDCRPDDEVIFTRSTTDSLNLLARALPAGCQVFVFATEHHASLLPWRDARVTYLDAPRSPGQAVDALERALALREPHGPALVCVTGASNVTGELWPVTELAAAAHAHGARIVLDAAQLAPHHPVSVRDLDVDWVAFSGHKLYAPFGAGVLAGRTDWLHEAEPYLAGGGASRRVTRRDDGSLDVEWHCGAARHEAGSPNVIGAYAIASACKALTEAGFDALVEREQHLIRRVRAGLAEVPEVKVLSLFGDDAPRVGVISFVVEGFNSSRFAAALSAEWGIGVRDGLFCAHPLVRTLLGTDPETQGECGAPEAAPGEASLNAVRVSFGAGTPDEHVERFVTAVRELVRDGARWQYRTEGGRCVPVV
ncbi:MULTISPECIES: aminotransferase class V-fold PLP-dependent enzyme [Streptomyces]|uniref:Aminotransferase class V-fold PLP-dependent enzyme n=1 Tax=Streptomyces thermoviolaceus subsp. thermoviolaceus TaxID=66860 RepID=A0ABX0YXI2_STRTL|nr:MULTISPECIES: aminotransferase class V-fold PLP-dependent enzyme [Streptomyces]WTD49545.1 aminotransferase class V-fold PLP-dependent enzyme [Streptomyces thermoviolaceus]NJP16732.1 aminotransferase class V-fold PLP-dependent enzyme [Streptomyces thermoviolaceus subsp. thermoviolaceus]RSS04034.1 aminotransferase class V-fold PLP-dependent enzyme [Streptomyces sp. WAC00469]GGV61738.1 aminotransferase [Streptomyces thermoviolaceus subsp. apingens]GHA79425.1 aminotransferase [Streptomyces ther